jgi:hypothetical protein
MKLKSILLAATATLSLATATMAQVPNYLPTNGIVGWWPFNGNANDESGNGNNGIVNGANLTSDRFSITNSAFDFDGFTNYISLNYLSSFNNANTFTVSVWAKISNYNNANDAAQYIISRGVDVSPGSFLIAVGQSSYSDLFGTGVNGNAGVSGPSITEPIPQSNWHHLATTFDGLSIRFFIDGVLVGSSVYSQAFSITTDITLVGRHVVSGFSYFVNGKIDDIGIWDRALTQQEITSLYNASNCANNTTIAPQINSLTTGSTATFTTTTSDPNPSYVWQSDFGQGFQTLNNFENYSGVNSATLNISNVQLANHYQPIRVISTSGDCIDTSNVAVINILDTCITNVTVYDTLLTTVTDTLIINATITGINPPNNLNTLKVFPNPASTHITIDYGNFNTMSGYTLTIVNSIGQTVFTTPVNQQTSYIDLSTWTGTGIYFVRLIDPQNNTIENRKIVIQ